MSIRDRLRGVGTSVQEDVLDQPEELLRDLLVDRELACIHDSHVHPGGDGVVEKGRVHRLADGGVPAEGERDVRDAARDLRVRQLRLDSARRLEEGEGCLLYTSDAADERSSVDLGGGRFIKKKKTSTAAVGGADER